MTLQELFPELPFAKDADKFLAKRRGNSDAVSELRERRICIVKFQPLFSDAGLGITDDGNFFVALNEQLPSEELAQSLGHEIGHTFHNDLSTTPPTHSAPNVPLEQLEGFCDAFAKLWLSQRSKQDIPRRIDNSRGLL